MTIRGELGTQGIYQTKFSVKRAKPGKEKGLVVPAGGTLTVPFGAAPGDVLKVTVKEKSGPALAGVRVLDRDGVEVPGSAEAFTRKKKRLSVKDLPLDGPFGEQELELTGSADGDTTVDVKLALKFRKAEKRQVVVGNEATVTRVTPTILHQEDEGIGLTVVGEHFLPGTEVEVEGLDVVSVDSVDDEAISFTVDVPPDAAIGAHAIVLYPPPDIGEPVFLDDSLTVRAPIPILVSVEGTPVVQGDQDKVLTVHGTGFRPGAIVEIASPDIEIVWVTVVDSTRAEVHVNVAPDATVGIYGLSFTQDDDGEESNLPWAVPLHYPTAVVASVLPNYVRMGWDAREFFVFGENFRPGDTVEFGEGVGVGAVTVESDTVLRVTAGADAEAETGPRDVVVTHDEGGGGAAGMLEEGMKVSEGPEEAKLTADDAEAGDEFGNSIDVDGDRLVVGAPGDDDLTTSAGAAYVYVRSGTSWVQEDKIYSSDKSAYIGQFGKAVAIDGDRIAVGAPRFESADGREGAVYVSTRKSGGWEQTTKLVPDAGTIGGDLPQYGSALDLHGDWLIVGAPEQYVSGGRGAGVAYIYHREDGDWTLFKMLSDRDPNAGEKFGAAVAIDGKYAFVSATFKRLNPTGEGSTELVGAVSVFELRSDVWTFVTSLKGESPWTGSTCSPARHGPTTTAALPAPCTSSCWGDESPADRLSPNRPSRHVPFGHDARRRRPCRRKRFSITPPSSATWRGP